MQFGAKLPFQNTQYEKLACHNTERAFPIDFHSHWLKLDAMKAILGTMTVVAVSLCMLAATSAQASVPQSTVIAWGADYDQATWNLQLTNLAAIAGGSIHSLAVKTDGTVIAWGTNNYGQTDVPAGLTNVVAIAGGGSHSIALRADGTATAWGGNTYGQTNVPGYLTNVIAIAAGGYHSLALKADGRVTAWGDGSVGKTNVPASLTNAIAIAAGGSHSIALRSDGTVVAWGWNGFGQTNTPAGLTNVIAVAAGADFNLLLKGDGTVAGWGKFYTGSAYVNMTVPVDLSGVAAIAAGSAHCLALKTNGEVVAWGINASGQTDVPGGLTNGVAIAAGYNYSLVMTPFPVIWLKSPPANSLASGSGTNLGVSVRSGSPYAIQWYFNGSLIGGAIATNLVVDTFNLAKAGVYSVRVENSYSNESAAFVLRLKNSPLVIVDGVDVGGDKVNRVDSAQIVMTNTGSGAAIYFTLDGSTPDFTDIPYTGPFTLTNSATIRAIAYNFAFTDSADAAPITVQVWPTYPLSATTPGGGSIGLSPAPYSAGNRYVSNTVVTLTATPASNWSFLGWTGDSSATSNVTSVLMDRARTVTGGFGTALNLFTNGSGQVQLNPPTGLYAFGATVQLTALPAPGYYFFGWANAASGFGNPLTFPVTNAAGITANFGALAGNQVSLVVLPNGNGTVSVNPAAKNVYTNGESVTLTAWPSANQTFTGWSGDAAGTLNPLVLALTSSQLITANFAPGAPTNPPVITQPPLSRTLSAGADTLLSFALTGDGPFSYQWRLNQSAVSGATNPSLALSGVTPAQAGRYDVVVVGAGGAVTSAPASVGLFGMQFIPSGGAPLPLLILDGAIGTQYRLETSPDLSLSNWSLLTPATLTNPRYFYADTSSSNQPARFYRAVPQ
jgi:hypothetical protein